MSRSARSTPRRGRPCKNALGDIWAGTRNTILFITHDIREAIYLSDRVLVMSGRPAAVSLELAIDLPRPRHRHDALFQEYEARLEAAIGHRHEEKEKAA